ncbi:MAG: sensor histidine kinase, partial [Huintestinicola sp.]
KVTALIIAAAVLGVICLLLLIRIIRYKKAMKDIRSELIHTREKDYDRQITISLFDKDLSDMAAEINKNLYFQKNLKLESERAEKLMRQSVSDIAHDLRTPLTVIRGNLQLLENEDKLSEKGVEHLRISMENTDMLKSMTDEFFELSVLESDDARIMTDRLDVTGAFLQFMADSEAVISQSGLVPEITFPEKSIFINADEQMLRRMLGNLLNNEIKYSKGRFFAGLYEEGESCIISFSNEITPDHQPDPQLIFERTYRGDRARKSGSAGLGLYIVKLLAEKQGAAVSADTDENRLTLKIIFKVLK